MCGHPSLDRVTEGRSIGRQMWVRWDPERRSVQPASAIQPASVPVIQPRGLDYDSDSTIAYDLEAYMDITSHSWVNFNSVFQMPMP